MKTVNGYDTYTDLFLAIANINQEIYEMTKSDYIYLKLESNVFVTRVYIFDIILWSSEDELDREYDEEKDKYEPIEDYIRKRVNEEINNLKKIKL